MIRQSVVDLKTKRDPNSPRWQSEFPVFLGGGGSAMPFYKTTMSQLDEWLQDYCKQGDGMNIVSLPKPADLVAEGVTSNDYHRLAVAWGLSYPDIDIGQVTRPTDIDDIGAKRTTNWRDKEVTKEMT